MNKQPFPFADLNKVIAFVALTLVIGLVTNAWALSLPFTKTVKTSTIVNDDVADQTDNWQIYTNEEYGVSVKYPADWRNSTSANSNSLIAMYKPSTTSNYPSSDNPMDIYIQIYVIANHNHLTLQELFDEEYQSCLIEAAEMGCPGPANVANFKSVEINGTVGLQDSSPSVLQGITTYFDKNDYFIAIAGSKYNLSDSYDFSKDYNQILSTFKFDDSSIDLKAYTNPTTGFTFQYPNNFTISETTGGLTVNSPDPSDISLAGLAIKDIPNTDYAKILKNQYTDSLFSGDPLNQEDLVLIIRFMSIKILMLQQSA